MIGRLSGILLEKNPPQLLIDCNGVGYEVSVPMSTFYNLPGLGEKVVLLTHFVVREDAQLLYGFGNAGEVRNQLKKYLQETYKKAEEEMPKDVPMGLKKLYVVALVQDDNTREVLHAVQVEVEESK